MPERLADATWSETCDWGNCDEPSICMRFSREDDAGWVPVCVVHAVDAVSDDLSPRTLDAARAERPASGGDLAGLLHQQLCQYHDPELLVCGVDHDGDAARLHAAGVRPPHESADPGAAGLREALAELEDWKSGRRSWQNLGPNPPYTPDVIAAMDAQEVVKLSAYIQARAALAAEAAPQPEPAPAEPPPADPGAHEPYVTTTLDTSSLACSCGWRERTNGSTWLQHLSADPGAAGLREALEPWEWDAITDSLHDEGPDLEAKLRAALAAAPAPVAPDPAAAGVRVTGDARYPEAAEVSPTATAGTYVSGLVTGDGLRDALDRLILSGRLDGVHAGCVRVIGEALASESPSTPPPLDAEASRLADRMTDDAVHGRAGIDIASVASILRHFAREYAASHPSDPEGGTER